VETNPRIPWGADSLLGEAVKIAREVSGQKARLKPEKAGAGTFSLCAFLRTSQEPFPHCSVVEQSLLACFRKLNSLRGSSTVKRPQQAVVAR
jgi:hypothetical protein